MSSQTAQNGLVQDRYSCDEDDKDNAENDVVKTEKLCYVVFRRIEFG